MKKNLAVCLLTSLWASEAVAITGGECDTRCRVKALECASHYIPIFQSADYMRCFRLGDECAAQCYRSEQRPVRQLRPRACETGSACR